MPTKFIPAHCVFCLSIFGIFHKTVQAQFEATNFSILNRPFLGNGVTEKGKDINIGVIQVKLKYKPPPESPIANISDKHELDLAGNHSENRSVWIIDRLELGKQPDSRGRPERQAWMREVEQIFGSSVVYFLIGFAVALIVFFVILYCIMNALLRQRHREKKMMEEARSQRHNDDDGDFGEEWDVDEYDDELYEQNGKDDDYEDDLADQYLVRKHTADELSDYTPHSRIMRNAGQRSQERRQWEQAFPARRIPRNGRGSQPPPILPPLPPPPRIRPPPPPISQRYSVRREEKELGNKGGGRYARNLQKNRPPDPPIEDEYRVPMPRRTSESASGIFRTRTASL